jgi:hypothetical protein
MKIFFTKVICHKTYLRWYKSHFERFINFVIFGHFRCSWIRIRISNTDQDSGEPNQCETLDFTVDHEMFSPRGPGGSRSWLRSSQTDPDPRKSRNSGFVETLN